MKTADARQNEYFRKIYRSETDIGLLVGVCLPRRAQSIPDDVIAGLHPEEQAFAAGLSIRRRITWIGGRIAMREALGELGISCGSILADERGAPALPRGIAGSISHKEDIAVALASIKTDWAVGVDVEHIKPVSERIARRIMSVEELERLESLPKNDRNKRILSAFSIKEAFFKALTPEIQKRTELKDIAVILESKISAFHKSQDKNIFSDIEITQEEMGDVIISAVGMTKTGL